MNIYQYILQNKRRSMLLVLFFFGVLPLLFFILTFGTLTITGKDAEQKNISITNSDRFKKKIELTNNSKREVLRKDRYTISASNSTASKVSIYSKSIGWFWNDTLMVGLKNQKKADYLGQSPLACATTIESAVYFYSCKPSYSATIVSASSNPSVVSEDELVAKNSRDKDKDRSSQALQPYGNSFLDFKVVNKSLEISERLGNNFESQKTLYSQKNFGADISDSSVSITPQSKSFAVYNQNDKNILRFNDTLEQQPVTLKLPANIDTKYYSNTLYSGNQYVYFLNYPTTIDLTGSSPRESKPTTTPKFITFNAVSGKIEKEFSVPKEWQIGRVVPGPDDQFLVFLTGDLQGEIYLFQKKSSPVKIEGLSNTLQDACWKSSSSFYYATDSSTKIFEYSLEDAASYLRYSGLTPGSFVSNLTCNNEGSLSFTTENSTDGETTKLAHFKLNSQPFKGVRLESVLPTYFNVAESTFRMTLSENGSVVVKKIYQDSGANTPSEQAVLEKAKNVLKKKDVNINSISIEVE